MRIDTNVSWYPPLRLMYPARGGVLLSVDENDRVYAQQESYGPSSDGTGDHRYQAMLMPHGNDIAAFWTDLGPATDFLMDGGDGQKYQAPPYLQPVLLEHTVGECRHMAELGRMDDYAAKLLHTQVNESDLFARYAMLIEQDMNLVRNRSTFGRYQRIERNGYSRYGAQVQQERVSNGHV